MAKKAILYTGGGDEGYTSLLGADRVAKHDLRPEAYGTVDECSAFLGLVRADPLTGELTKRLILEVQRDLWLLMAELASAPGVVLPNRLQAARVTWLESQIDQLSNAFPPLNKFVIPGDTHHGALLDVARTIARRAERRVTHLMHEYDLDNAQMIRYLNRLSSLLFALARYEDYLTGQESTVQEAL